MEVNCLNCKERFEALPKEIKRGNAKFCSHKCAGSFRSTKLVDNVSCSLCHKSFYLCNSKQNKSKSGLFFCCREHKDLAQRADGIKEIHPSHYKDNLCSYRDKALRNLESICSKCGWNTFPEVLEVNHKDCNRRNNKLENLELLCPTCHEVFHFTTKTGKWSKRLDKLKK